MITSPANTKVKYVQRLQAERRFRMREQLYVAEGTRWLKDVVQQKTMPHTLFYTADWLAVPEHYQLFQQVNNPSYAVSAEVMAAMSDTETPAGILLLLPIQPRPLPTEPHFLLILDGISTPGNMGTMLRTAVAAGVDGVLLAPGCVDVYNPKVVRGGMGAHLRLPLQSLSWEMIAGVVQGFKVWLAAVDGEQVYTAVSWQHPSALIIGNEAAGAGKEAGQLANGRITIPMAAATESLNAAVATGIILFEAVRQRNAV